MKGKNEENFRTGNVDLSPENIGAPSSEYISEHFVGDYISSIHTQMGGGGEGWYRIARFDGLFSSSCVITIERSGDSPDGYEFHKVQVLGSYYWVSLVELSSYCDEMLWDEIRSVIDEGENATYIEIHQKEANADSRCLFSIENATSPLENFWKAITPKKTEESVNGVIAEDTLALSVGFGLNVLAKKDGSNVNGTWNGLTAGRAVRDGNGNKIPDTYARKKLQEYLGSPSNRGGSIQVEIPGIIKEHYTEFLIVYVAGVGGGFGFLTIPVFPFSVAEGHVEAGSLPYAEFEVDAGDKIMVKKLMEHKFEFTNSTYAYEVYVYAM